MIRTALVAAALVMGLSTIGLNAVLAQSDPIAERKNVMKGVGGATGQGAKFAKGEEAYDAAKAQAIFKTYSDAAKKMPSLYPANSKTGGDTSAAPKIWEDEAGFKAAFAKFDADVSANATAAATDLASFRTAFGNVTKNCGSCHETYRIKK
jgi:cytochrome c556